MKWFFIWITLLCPSIVSVGQPLPRSHFSVRLEPETGILVGAGQTNVAPFTEFAAATKSTPAFFITYLQLNLPVDTFVQYVAHVKSQLDSIPAGVMVQLGLSFSGTNTDRAVAEGKYDSNLTKMTELILQSGRKWYIRPGYEFNLSFLKYQPSFYRRAFRRIAGYYTGNENVAMVWNCAGGNANTTWANVKIWYPGDDVVDWFAWNFFKGQYEGVRDYSVIKEYCDSAELHQKPVMLAEAAPRASDQQVTQGIKSWDAFFVPFFDVIQTLPQIKAFGYINWYWPDYTYIDPVFAGWGDSRIQSNQLVLDSFNSRISDSAYIFAPKVLEGEPDTFACKGCAMYIFTGNGNWDDSSNWVDRNMPPDTVLAGSIILINPPIDGECILNKPQTIANGAKMKVMPGKRFLIVGLFKQEQQLGESPSE